MSTPFKMNALKNALNAPSNSNSPHTFSDMKNAIMNVNRNLTRKANTVANAPAKNPFNTMGNLTRKANTVANAPAKNPFNTMGNLWGALTQNTKNTAVKKLTKSVKGLNRRLQNARNARNAVNRASRNLQRAARIAYRRTMRPENVRQFKNLRNGPSNAGNVPRENA